MAEGSKGIRGQRKDRRSRSFGVYGSGGFLQNQVTRLILVLLSCACLHAQEATLAVVNARVWTANPAKPWAEAVAASAENILAVGTTAEIQKLTNSKTRIIDAHGHMLVPGFIDSHVHFLD